MLQEIEIKPITEINDQTLTLSTAASDAVKNILEERKLEGYALRVYVAGGGCCGVNFGMALDNNFRDVDTTFDINGIQVVVDEVSIDYLRGASIDYVNDPVRGAGFAVDSPNAANVPAVPVMNMPAAVRVVAAAAPAIARTNKQSKKTETSWCFFYLPRKYDITAPKKPNNPRLMINNPVGIPVSWYPRSLNEGIKGRRRRKRG